MKLKLDSSLGKIFAEAKVSIPFMEEQVMWVDTQQTAINGKEIRVWLEDKEWYVEVPDKLFEEFKPKSLPVAKPKLEKSQIDFNVERLKKKEEKAKEEKIAVFNEENILHEVVMHKREWNNRWIIPFKVLSEQPIILGTIVRVSNAKTNETYSTPSVTTYKGMLSIVVSGDPAHYVESISQSSMIKVEFSKYVKTYGRLRLYLRQYADPTQVEVVKKDTVSLHGNKYYMTSVEKVYDSEDKKTVMPFDDKNIHSTWILDKKELLPPAKIVFNREKVSKANIKIGQVFALMPLSSDNIIHSSILRSEHTLGLSGDVVTPLFSQHDKCRIVFSKFVVSDPNSRYPKIHEGIKKSLLLKNKDNKLFT